MAGLLPWSPAPEHPAIDTVAAALLEQAARWGVSRAFGIPGVHNLPFWDAEGAGRPPILGVRHEQAAVYAADGLARATGEPGLALLTSGPGAANATAAFGEAASVGSPVLVVASDVAEGLRAPDGPRGILHEMADQAGIFASFGRPARTVATAAEALRTAAALWREVLGRRRVRRTSASRPTCSASRPTAWTLRARRSASTCPPTSTSPRSPPSSRMPRDPCSGAAGASSRPARRNAS